MSRIYCSNLNYVHHIRTCTRFIFPYPIFFSLSLITPPTSIVLLATLTWKPTLVESLERMRASPEEHRPRTAAIQVSHTH